MHLSRIAAKLPFQVRLRSVQQRLNRFLSNSASQVRSWYRPVAQALLEQAAAHGPVRLLLDSTKVGVAHQLLIVTLAYRKRALPLVWSWVSGTRGHSDSDQQLALLQEIHALLPAQTSVVVAGDCEFGAVAVIRQLQQWHWHYVLRQKGSTLVCVSHTTFHWQRFDELVPAKQRCFLYCCPHELSLAAIGMYNRHG